MSPDPTVIARLVTEDFVSGRLAVSRPNSPIPSGWDAMPECVAAADVRSTGASPAEIRCFITLVMAVDRSRDADRLWRIAAETYQRDPWLFDPAQVVAQPPARVRDLLRDTGISQRHGVDSSAWLSISAALTRPTISPDVYRAVYAGDGDAHALRLAVTASSGAEGPLFPLLRGPRTSVVWIRALVVPGEAVITNLAQLPVAVNVQTRKLSEYLGVTNTGDLPDREALPRIEQAWCRAASDAAGPEPIAGTRAALDPALWFYGKWGCTNCENVGRKEPIGRACASCRFPTRG